MIAYEKGRKGIVNLHTGKHDSESTIKCARKWIADDTAIDEARQ